uniref:NACHT domain-containing protein n=1 Tax=Gasterosteus aculeatus aculeatus TaxID=481459 RepID=G3NZZ1_GASAC
ASLPPQVEVSEYQLLLQESQRAGVSTLELERQYQRDENAVPPSYRLRARKGGSERRQVERQEELLSELCDNFLPGLITTSQLIVYTTTTKCDCRHGYTKARRRGYAESLCQQVYSDLVVLTDGWSISEVSGDVLAREQADKHSRCNIASFEISFYLLQVRDFVQQSGQQRPLVVTGGPCTGKTVLLAHCAQQMRSWLPDCDPVVITYFCDLSINPTPTHLLSCLCYQIGVRYHSESSSEQSTAHMDNLNICSSELQERLSSLLASMPSAEQPLVLVLDGLAHMENNAGAQILESLPCPLPPSVKLVLTVSSNRKQVLQAINPPRSPPHAGEGSGYACVQLGPVDRRPCGKMLASLLSSSGRRVTSGQQALVNRALTSCPLTLYARLLHLHTSLWHSDSDVTESSLPAGVHSSISALLDHLEQKHGSCVVARAVSYLTLSRTGLTEVELVDLLSADPGVLTERVRCIPQVAVETLLLDLRRFLIRRTVAGSRVLFWVSRHFKLVVAKRCLATREAERELHSAMADYFSGRLPCGGNQDEKRDVARTESHTSREPQSVETNSQPFVFSSSSEEVGRVNLRKVLELPHHLRESGRWGELERGLLMSLVFHQAMVRAGLLGELVAMLESEEGSPHLVFPRERALLAGVLKSCACFLQNSPLHLPSVMEANLLPYLEVFPGLQGYAREIGRERRRRGRGLGVLLCPAQLTVPSVRRLTFNAKTKNVSVREAAGTESGVVVQILDDGTAWIWKGSGWDVVRLSLICEQKELTFTGLKSSGHFILFSTQCDKLLLWDVTGPETFLQVTAESSRNAANGVEGFVASQKSVFMWWKGESFVSAFDVSNETMTHFQCHSAVTCLACSSSGVYMYCGQEEGTVAIFDTNTGSLLGTCSNSNLNAIKSIILCDDEWEMTCVDRTGGVSLWDVASKINPPRLVAESFVGGESNDVLNIDYSHGCGTLLMCQSHQVVLWDTCDWEPWDQFLAPPGKTFARALLSRGGRLFLALLDACPSVLVWSVSTGQCVLSLETSRPPRALLATASCVVGVDDGDGATAWDSETIEAAAAAPKMGLAVKEVAVERTGEFFYTSDGSRAVWRWGWGTGLPHAKFLHHGAVEKLRLSPDGVHLVTLSAGDIYVWRTGSGQNVLRVSGSAATDVLIAPNGNFGVSVSERGLSRVWKLAHGGVVCSIHPYLSDAKVSPASTFLIGRRRGDLLAASLWSGSVSKRFSRVVGSERVVAFHTLSEHPDFVVVMAASGAVYTWNVSEETLYEHFQLPRGFRCQPRDFQVSSDGSYALLSADDEAVNLLDLSRVRLCSFEAEGPVVKVHLDGSGRYVAYVCRAAAAAHVKDRARLPREEAVLAVVRLADGERIGSVRLAKSPSALVVCERRRVFVGFEDGSVGVYSILDGEESPEGREKASGRSKRCAFDGPLSCLGQARVSNSNDLHFNQGWVCAHSQCGCKPGLSVSFQFHYCESKTNT